MKRKKEDALKPKRRLIIPDLRQAIEKCLLEDMEVLHLRFVDSFRQDSSALCNLCSLSTFKHLWTNLGMHTVHQYGLRFPKVLRTTLTQELFLLLSKMLILSINSYIKYSSRQEYLLNDSSLKVLSLLFSLYFISQTQVRQMKIPIRISPVSWLRLLELDSIFGNLAQFFPIASQQAIAIFLRLQNKHAFSFCISIHSGDMIDELNQFPSSNICDNESARNYKNRILDIKKIIDLVEVKKLSEHYIQSTELFQKNNSRKKRLFLSNMTSFTEQKEIKEFPDKIAHFLQNPHQLLSQSSSQKVDTCTSPSRSSWGQNSFLRNRARFYEQAIESMSQKSTLKVEAQGRKGLLSDSASPSFTSALSKGVDFSDDEDESEDEENISSIVSTTGFKGRIEKTLNDLEAELGKEIAEAADNVKKQYRNEEFGCFGNITEKVSTLVNDEEAAELDDELDDVDEEIDKELSSLCEALNQGNKESSNPMPQGTQYLSTDLHDELSDENSDDFEKELSLNTETSREIELAEKKDMFSSDDEEIKLLDREISF